MRILAVNTMMSLDRIVQSPGGPDEDPTGGFALGGWGVTYVDEEMLRQVAEAKPYELLLGRGTYEPTEAELERRRRLATASPHGLDARREERQANR